MEDKDRRIYCEYTDEGTWDENVKVSTSPDPLRPCEIHYASFAKAFNFPGRPAYKNGLKFTVDVRDVEVTLDEPPKTYRRGERFMHSGSVSILANFEGSMVALIDLEGGNRWSNPVEVKDVWKITEEEFTAITDGSEFVRIEKKDC